MRKSVEQLIVWSAAEPVVPHASCEVESPELSDMIETHMSDDDTAAAEEKGCRMSKTRFHEKLTDQLRVPLGGLPRCSLRCRYRYVRCFGLPADLNTGSECRVRSQCRSEGKYCCVMHRWGASGLAVAQWSAQNPWPSGVF